MSRFFPLAEYAEDQPLGHTILTVHVLARGATTGAVIGTASYGVRNIYRRFRPAAPHLLQSAGRGTIAGTAFLAVALAARMHGRDEIEWRDRSWRLLVNRGQVECDDWTVGGVVLGLAGLGLGVVRGDGKAGVGVVGRRVQMVQMVGAAGLGSVLGTIGYMGWRYGIHGGKWEDGENI
ncbi:hypothetical protein BD289DRAFT_376705 [Coniella lustricola]|uniref:Uncharacterized protein n=1 Tax=Coniella lustricola TaxID=2025994 RepID=A0A2T2ZWH3_9PEZI|nr:hypothetical protein BD289DRAFT_376705 [Coniella lustricola]